MSRKAWTALLGLTILGADVGHSSEPSALLRGTVVKVHDGDTFTLASGIRIRLFGIDTPELSQQCREKQTCVPCGEQARSRLVALIGEAEIICEPRGKSFDRTVARCAAADLDLGLSMVEAGQAVVSERYIPKRDPTRARYLDIEAKARRAKIGLWNLEFVMPEDWRRHKQRLQCELP